MAVAFFLLVFTLCATNYLLHHLKFYRGLKQLRHGTATDHPSVSIIIPARNEATSIGHCLDSLLNQNYPQEKVEIIVVDDHSTDSTAAIVHHYQNTYQHIHCIRLNDPAIHPSPKKYAITTAISLSQHDIIITTDADCTMPPNWLKTLTSHFKNDTGVVAGWVAMNPDSEKTLFHKIQALEFLSLVITGAGAIGAGFPIIANGANLAYRKSVYNEVNGFEGIDHLVSGDDDLFIQKVARQTAWRIRSAWEHDATVRTTAVNSFGAFIRQRTRWASKGVHYESSRIVWYLVSVYIFYVGLFIGIPVSIFNFPKLTLPFYLFSLKLSIDGLVMWRGLTLAGRRDLIRFFLPAMLFQIPYIILVGFIGLFGNISWKEHK
ncbi:glycosyltransferase [candidate division KSB1 bacterium]|nr:glycosyltransferase [candidate division KSB1 bacterium]